MASRSLDPPPAEPAGRLWRETLGQLAAWLEAQGLEPDRAQELSESVVIVCALRHAPRSREDALDLAMSQAAAMR